MNKLFLQKRNSWRQSSVMWPNRIYYKCSKWAIYWHQKPFTFVCQHSANRQEDQAKHRKITSRFLKHTKKAKSKWRNTTTKREMDPLMKRFLFGRVSPTDEQFDLLYFCQFYKSFLFCLMMWHQKFMFVTYCGVWKIVTQKPNDRHKKKKLMAKGLQKNLSMCQACDLCGV